MLYAREVIDLMAAYPEREWRMKEIVRYCNRGELPKNLRERNRIRTAVARAIEALREMGCIESDPPDARRGSYAVYRWKGGAV